DAGGWALATNEPHVTLGGQVEAAGNELAIDAHVAVQRPVRSQGETARALVDSEERIEPEQIDQGIAVIGVEPAGEIELRAVESRQGVERERFGRRISLALQADLERAGAAVDLEQSTRRASLPLAADRQRCLDLGRNEARRAAAELGRRLRRDLLDQRRNAVERAGIEVERDAATRCLGAGIDVPVHRQRGAAEVPDHEASDVEAAAVELDVDVGAPRFDAGDGSTAGIERELALARPLEPR